MIAINTNFSEFRQGIFDACKLFKTIYQKNRYVLLYEDNQLFKNNLERLCNIKNDSYGAYSFGYFFVQRNVDNFRQNICINPILYITALENIVRNCRDIKDFEKYKGINNEICQVIKDYFEISNLSKAMITLQDVKNLFNEDNKFLNQVIEQSYYQSNVQIIESKENKIVQDKYYRIKGNLICGEFYKQDCFIFITDCIDRKLYKALLELRRHILIICTACDVEVENSYYLTIIKTSLTAFVKHYDSICILTGAGRGYYNLELEELNHYSFGQVKEFKFVDGELQFSVNEYLLANDTRLDKYNTKESRNVYYSLQGKNTIIYTTEENMEKVRNITSLVKSLVLEGVFYDEIKTLKLLEYYFNTKPFIAHFCIDILKDFLTINDVDNITIEKIIQNKDLLKTYDLKTKQFIQSENFQALDYYRTTFSLLESNINTLYKLN